MTTSEIFSKCTPKSPALIGGIGGKPELTWEDVEAALAGTERKHEGFIRYVYMDNPLGYDDFFDGLKSECISRLDVQMWVKRHPKKLDKLINLAIREWKHSRQKYTDKSRAFATGIKYHNWMRHYRNIYAVIVGLPAYWEDQVLQHIRRKLSA